MTSPSSASEAVRRKIHKMGPGTFVLGSVGTMLDISCQITNFKVSAEADAEDSEPVLCGDNIPGQRNYTWTVSGTAFQDIETDGLIDFTWKNAGTEMPFKFVPDSATESTITGRVMVDPVEYGGDVNQKNKSDFEWAAVGTPNFKPNE
ncbi:hypothetical protein [Corynebacterium accolens]|uniref:Phage tail protein n=1 Tax=Corynebacterium accolens TaxID=38284 RepID=A0AAP4FAZ5_9CORY|nr:hypothetical protein [Corynebacterium accolens]MDK4334024.1 hypothetical protein [Corynebacterium accolens]